MVQVMFSFSCNIIPSVLLEEQAVPWGELKATCHKHSVVAMKISIVILAILLVGPILGAAAFSNYYSINNSQTPTPTIQPTSNPTVTPQPNLEPTASPSPTPTPTATLIRKPSILMVISPTNTAYSTNSIELTYNINSKVLWSYYSIDASDYVDVQHLLRDNGWISFEGNITLNLSEGPHRLKIAVQTEESRFSSVPIAYQTIDFVIDTTNVP